MGDRSDHRSASHDVFAHVARGEAEVSQAPAEVQVPRPDLTCRAPTRISGGTHGRQTDAK